VFDLALGDQDNNDSEERKYEEVKEQKNHINDEHIKQDIGNKLEYLK